MKRITTLLLFFCLMMIYQKKAESAAFDQRGIGARARGMGNAFTSISNDATATYWNPAGLATQKKHEFYLKYNDMYSLGLINTHYLAYAHPNAGPGGAGIAWSRLATNSDKIKNLSYAENVGYFSYGYRTPLKFLRIGATIKFYNAKANEVVASGAGGDLGVLIGPVKGITVGIVAQDYTTTSIEWQNTNIDKIPLNWRIGASYKYKNRVTLSFDVDRIRETSPDYHFGTEIVLFNNIFTLRNGVIFRNLGGNSFSFGMGLRFKKWFLDYAYEHNPYFSGAHDFSLSTKF